MASNNEALVISAANLDVIERNLGNLANNVGQVSSNIEHVDSKVNKVTDSVKTIEEEIKNFMVEIRGSTVVANAKQSITLDQDEINKQYGHYDNVRRKINGIFQATDINSIKKSTIENISEQVIIDTPNYWLAPALVAICAWFNDNKDLANRALKEAMTRDDEKTSLLFCLIHLRAGRNDTALRWLRRYLEMQDPTKMENKIVTIIDAITNGTFDVDARTMCLDKINTWLQELNNQPEYRNIQVDRWTTCLNSWIKETEPQNFYHLKNYTNQHDQIQKILAVTTSERNILEELKNILKEDSGPKISREAEIDKIINLLVFNYEDEELELRKDIAKNKLIVEENGNVNKALERFKETEFAFQKNTDFYSQLTNIVLENKSVKPTVNTRKLAFALSKDWILEAYNKNINNDENNNLNINIKIGNWNGNTINGSNEKELVQDLHNHINNDTNQDIYGNKLFDTKMMIATVIGVILTIICFIIKQPLIALVVLIGVLIVDGYFLFLNYTERENKIKKREERKKNETLILMNTIAEVVDFRFLYKDGKDTENEIIAFINSLDYNNYVKAERNQRNIQVGDLNARR